MKHGVRCFPVLRPKTGPAPIVVPAYRKRTSHARMHRSPDPEPGPAWIAAALERHERSLVAYATRLLGGDLERARDVVQDAFLRLCNERPADVDGHLTEWLFTVTRNRALDVRKKESRMTDLTEEHTRTRAGEATAATAPIDLADEARSVLARLDALPPKQREVLRLKFQHGLSYREIAVVTGETAGTVGWLIHVGIRNLRGKLAGEGVEA